MINLTSEEIQAMENHQPQKFKVVIVTDNGSYNLQDLNGKKYVKSISKNVSKDNRVATLSLTLEDFKHVLKGETGEVLFQANNQVKVYIKCTDSSPWRFIFHGVLGDEIQSITEHANGDITISQIRDLAKILQDDYITEAENKYKGYAEEVIQQILDDRFGENVFNIKIPTLSEFYVENYIPEYTNTWDAVQKIADHIGWDLRFKYDETTDSFRLIFYMPDRDPIYYDYEFLEENLDSESLSTSDAYIRNVIRVRNQAKDIDVTVKDEDSINNLSTVINGKEVGGKRYMEISQEDTSLIDDEIEAENLANAILYDLSEQHERSNIVPRNIKNVLFHFEVHDSIQINNTNQRKESKLYVIDSYSWTAQKNSCSTNITLSDKVTINYKRWLEKETLYQKPINPEKLRNNPPEEVEVFNITEQSYIDKNGGFVSNILVKTEKPNDNRYKEAVISIKEESEINYSEEGVVVSGTYIIKGVDVGTIYNVKIESRGVGGQTSQGIVKTIQIFGKDSKPPNVNYFIVTQKDTDVLFEWELPDRDIAPDIAGVEIRKGTDWGAGKIVDTYITGETHTKPLEVDGTHTYMIRTIDRSGQYSLTTVSSKFEVYGTGDNLNIIQERDELNYVDQATTTRVDQINGKTSFYHMFSLDDLDGYSLDDWDSLDALANGLPDFNPTAELITEVLDTGQIGKKGIRLSDNFKAEDPEASLLSFPDKGLDDFPNNSLDNPPAEYNTNIYVSFSNDNSTWTDWQKFVSGEYKFRYIKLKLDLEVGSETAILKISEFIEYMHAPDLRLEIDNLSIAVGGTTINYVDYNLNFYEIPKEYNSNVVQDGTTMKFATFFNKTKGSVDLKIVDINNDDVGGTAENIKIEGY